MVEPVRALNQIAFLLERAGESSYKVQAFRRAAAKVADLPEEELRGYVRQRTLTRLPGIGTAIAGVISQAVRGEEPEYLTRLAEQEPPVEGGADLRAALRGDCHMHSDWSDGGSPVRLMARTARELGHSWVALTDHSPRLTVANGLSADRLRRQVDLVAQLNEELAPFRVLTGIEVDILADGSLDQDEKLLAQLDVVVASVHSDLRAPEPELTRRMLAAVANPYVDVLGHCTGRRLTGRRRPESAFDAEAVFTACRDNGVAVEINSRPDRLDPPMRLLDLAVDLGCTFAIDSDAHAPGQLDWLAYGCERAERCGIRPEQVINTRSAAELVGDAGRGGAAPGWPVRR
ncbi:hypothetical protein KALB_4682 [Kutzneria albida DSM 43870]|uniref:Polymerase/histidinol phosphatase N-terminal domain-containing protein n=1 Tax=Kutzneria albida DSM 43870 TaxID=1449976 RepID=W5WIP7_9PSEU|nr:hypothetical protein KALB_4682 [Kutzneria albida DSM 43870]